MEKDTQQNTEENQVQDLDPLQKQALAILSGEVEAPNETIAYIVEKTKAVRDEAKQHSEQVAFLERELSRRRIRIAECRGAAMSYADDVKHWLQNTKIITPPTKKVIVPR